MYGGVAYTLNQLCGGWWQERLFMLDPDLVVLSPGPGRPEDFPITPVIEAALEQQRPLFGVCLGLQAMTEHFGGSLEQLDRCVHELSLPGSSLQSVETFVCVSEHAYVYGRV